MKTIIQWVMTKLGLWEIISIPIQDDKWHTVSFCMKRGVEQELRIDELSVWKKKMGKRSVVLVGTG